MLINEDLDVTVKCRTAIKELVLYFNLCGSIKLDSLSCSFTFISFLTKTSNIHQYQYNNDVLMLMFIIH